MLTFTRLLSSDTQEPHQQVEWAKTDIIIRNHKTKEIIFACPNAEFPSSWSYDACKIVASKYFRQSRLTDEKPENSVRQMVERVVSALVKSGIQQGYFDEAAAKIFGDELSMALYNQYGSFNSPVWFNVGVPGVTRPTASACFINSVDDTMESILGLAKTEGLIFKEGAGSGVNFSNLRGSHERIRGGGTASGPVSFLQGFDSFANVILSGGRTRRAARMVILDVDHPDIEKFIDMKAAQEDIVKLLALAGMPTDFADPNSAYGVVKHQSGNNSVRVPNAFMEMARDVLHGYVKDAIWETKNRADGSTAEQLSVKKLFRSIAEAAHKCGDPGLQFSDTINAFNTCSNDGVIVASNPCLTGDMELETADGPQRLDKLAKQEYVQVRDPSGNISKGRVWPVGAREVVRLVFPSKLELPAIKCTPSHTWKLADGTVARAEDLKGKRLMPGYTVRVPTGSDAELAGFVQGDGQTGRLRPDSPHKGLEITFAAKDYEIAAMLGYDLQQQEPRAYLNNAYQLAQTYQIPSCSLPERTLPSSLPAQDECAFLCGLYSANGCVLANARVTLKTACPTLRDQVIHLLQKHDIHAYYTTNKSTKIKFPNGVYTCKENYDVNITRYASVLKFAEKISFLQTYKRTLLEQLILTHAPLVTAVKPAGVELVYDFLEPNTHWGVVNKCVAANCSEYLWLNNSACNLASLNLTKFSKEPKQFDAKLFKHVARLFITAQDIVVGMAGYPTEQIAQNSLKYRPLGLGYTNLGGLLMSWGLGYDSPEGRDQAAAITSYLTACAYQTSTEIAGVLGPFNRFEDNKGPMEDVLTRHMLSNRKLERDLAGLQSKAATVWKEVINTAFRKGTGIRNAQVTLLAPTGTLSWMMDCATTGIEPDIGLKKTKALVGGEVLEYCNPGIDTALVTLGYAPAERIQLMDYVREHGHFEGSALREEHLQVFDCALPIGNRRLSASAHIDMCAAVQPFLSGAISKTLNLPREATVEDVERTFLKAWEKGVKCATIYREGSKLSEPLRVRELKAEAAKPVQVRQRKRLPDEREQLGHRFDIGPHKGYLTVGFYENKEPGELFLRMAGHGSTVSGLLDSFATLVSLALQYGIPLEVLVSRFEGSRFTPSGWTKHPQIRQASSILDYVFKWLRLKFLDDKNIPATPERPSMLPPMNEEHDLEYDIDLTSDPCPHCGSQMRKVGATCHDCPSCGASTGICS